MNVCSNDTELEQFLKLAAEVSKKHPVVVSEFIQHAKEIEFDAVADHGTVIAYAISEHIEFAGVHSGDATIQFPPQKLYVETARRIKKIARKIAEALKISGRSTYSSWPRRTTSRSSNATSGLRGVSPSCQKCLRST